MTTNPNAATARSARAAGSEAGMVTAESALSLTALATVFVLLVAILSAAVGYFHAQDLSRAAARSLSLGTDAAGVAAQVRAAEPKATVRFGEDGDMVGVTVSVPPPGLLGRAGATVRATSVAAREPGAGK